MIPSQARTRIRACAILVAACALAIVPARADAQGAAAAPGGAVIIDATAVRYVSAETGGPTRPRFISQRVLAFEARVELLGQEGASANDPIDERAVRAAVEHHVAQDLLGSLPHDLPPPQAEVARVHDQLREALEYRVGGAKVLIGAAAAEGIDAAELDELVWRETLAAMYIDRSLSPLFHPTEDQLREAYRTAGHPFRTVRFEEARERLTKWFILDRVRSAEASFLQTGRSHVTIVYLSDAQ